MSIHQKVEFFPITYWKTHKTASQFFLWLSRFTKKNQDRSIGKKCFVFTIKMDETLTLRLPEVIRCKKGNGLIGRSVYEITIRYHWWRVEGDYQKIDGHQILPIDGQPGHFCFCFLIFKFLMTRQTSHKILPVVNFKNGAYQLSAKIWVNPDFFVFFWFG